MYPTSSLSDTYKSIIMLNPMSSIIETFRYGFLGAGTFELKYLIYSAGVTIFVLIIGIVIFSKVEKTFMDTV